MTRTFLSKTVFGALVLAFVNSTPTLAFPEGGSAAPDSSAEVKPDDTQLERVPKRHAELKWYTMFERIPGDWAMFGRRNFREERLPMIGAITGLTAFAIWTDQPVYDWSDKWYKSGRFIKDLSDFGVYIGDGKPQFGLAAAFGAFGYFADDERALRTGSQIVETILACGIVIQTLKHITGRESPFVSTRVNGRWVFFPNQVEYHKRVPHYDAFPSGHIATALATLTVILENYPEWKPWLQPLGYTLVALVGIGLSNTGIHWWSDYPLGLALGYEFGMIAAHPEGFDLSESADGNSPKLSLSPHITPIRQGVTLSLRF